MKITSIEKAKGKRYTIFVDGEYFTILDAEIMAKNNIKVDMEISQEEMDDLLYQAERRKGRERAYYLLSYRDHSKKELYEKLTHSVRPEVAKEVIALMEEQGYLNDENYAEKLVRNCVNTKFWGAKRIHYELIRKGIAKDLADTAVANCDVSYTDRIKQLIDKKYYDKMSSGEYKQIQKVIAAMLRVGYNYDDIKSAMAEWRTEQQSE